MFLSRNPRCVFQIHVRPVLNLGPPHLALELRIPGHCRMNCCNWHLCSTHWQKMETQLFVGLTLEKLHKPSTLEFHHYLYWHCCGFNWTYVFFSEPTQTNQFMLSIGTWFCYDPTGVANYCRMRNPKRGPVGLCQWWCVALVWEVVVDCECN